MSYCMYLRKSRTDLEAELQGEGETLTRHENILLNLARKQKLIVTAIYKEVVSGETISARPVMQQLLTEIEQGSWEGVLVIEIERLARGDTIDQGIVSQAFKYSNTKIITPMKIYDPNNEYDEEYFEFGLFMSRREYKTINRRLQRGRLESVKEGKYLGSIAPYGYKRKKLDKEKGYTLEVVSEEAEVVKLIFDMYAKQNKGIGLITRYLNSLEIKPRKADVWVIATIQDILKNPIYIGKIKWNSRPTSKNVVDGKVIKHRKRNKKEDIILVDGLHESIIEEQLFNSVQESLSIKSKTSVTLDKKIKNPLAGLVVCGVCGRKMVRRPYNTKQVDTLMCTLPSCGNISSPLYLVENRILEHLDEWLKEYEIDYKNKSNSNSDLTIASKKKTVKKLGDEILALEKQVDNIHNLLEQGIYTHDMFLQRSKILSEKIEHVNSIKDNLLKEIEMETKSNIIKEDLIPKYKKILEAYKHSQNPEHKNKLLKKILRKVDYIKTVNGRWHNSLDDFRVTIYPVIPKSK